MGKRTEEVPIAANPPAPLEPGDRCTTPGGPGTVVYRRMRGPEYMLVANYSVRLDARKADPTYTGTIYRAKDVEGGNS